MKVYLVRHGEAATSHDDPRRSLTQKGRAETSRIAESLCRLGVRVGSILCSVKPRAVETAEILARKLEPEGGVSERDGLLPNDSVGPWEQELPRADGDLMLVGHLPFMDELASRLLAGRGSAGLFKFEPSSVLCLERTLEGGWRVLFFLPGSPE